MEFDMKDISLSDSSSSYTVRDTNELSQSPLSVPRYDPQVSPNRPTDLESSQYQTAKRKGRKGHTKSRTGCFNCKRARIKCKENRPACDYCAHRGMICKYPDLQITQTLPQDSSTAGAMIRKPPHVAHLSAGSQIAFSIQSPTPAANFTIQDFRLFNHFIQNAYPHQPIGNDSVWKHEIPCIASDYDFLLYSMLALAASDLSNNSNSPLSLTSTALTHRVRAISCLNDAISSGIQSFQQGNAMLACCFALLFQSVLIEDGLNEYMMFIRGTLAVGVQMGKGGMPFLFTRLWDHQQVEQIDGMMLEAPLIQAKLASDAARSLERMRDLCYTKVEIDVYTALLGIARALCTSSRDSYMQLRKFYELFSWTMTQAEFTELTNPNNEICKLLQAHFVAVQMIMNPFTKNEWANREAHISDGREGASLVGWFNSLHRSIPSHLRPYFEWTLWIEQEVREKRIRDGKIVEETDFQFSKIL